MILKQYKNILNETDPLKQLECLGYDIKIMTLKQANKLIEKELNVEYEPKKYETFKVGKRKFKLLYDIEDLQAQEYAYFKQIVGNVYADNITQDDIIIPVSEEEKMKKLFNVSNDILAIFSKDITMFRKPLDYEQKKELFLEMDIQILIHILFFYSVVIGTLQKNGAIYYLEKMKQMNDMLE